MADQPLVTLETTAGDIVLELRPDAAPATVQNFLKYVEAGFYDGLIFHRIIPGFVAQAGGFTPQGDAKPPLADPIPLETSPLKHEDAALGMARQEDPNTATSEFYVCDGVQPELDGSYCVFGRLLDGRETVRRILATPTDDDDWPVRDPPVIRRAYKGREAPVVAKPAGDDRETVRAEARRLRGRAALLRARRPMMAMGDVENAIAQADRSGRREDLDRAKMMLDAKEARRS